MNTLPTHEYTQELLAANALDGLEPEDQLRVLEHLQDCPACSAALQEYRETAVLLAYGAPARRMDPQRSDRLRARLLAEARADRSRAEQVQAVEAPNVPIALVPRRRSRDWGRWVGWAVAAGLSSLLLTHHAFHRPLSLGWLAAAILGMLLVGVGIYAVIQRDRVRRMEQEMEELRARRGGPRSQRGDRDPSYIL